MTRTELFNDFVNDFKKICYSLPMPQNCTAELYAFMSQCWKSEPRMRPDIFQIVSSMQEKLINNSVSKKTNILKQKYQHRHLSSLS